MTSKPRPAPPGSHASGSRPLDALALSLPPVLQRLRTGAALIRATDDSAVVSFANASFVASAGRECADTELQAVFADLEIAELGAALRDHQAFRGQVVGSEGRVFELSLCPVSERQAGATWWLGMLRDLEQERASDVARIDAERLGCAQRLAASLAHEINNPLASLTTNLEWLVSMLGTAERTAGLTASVESAAGFNPISAALVDALAAVERIDMAMQHLGLLIGGPDSPAGLLDVRELLESALTELEGQLVGVKVVRDYGDVPPVLADEKRLKQALLALLQNAAQALEREPRQISLRVRARRNIRIEIEDSGTGVAPEVKERLFAPFVTTRPLGAGKGLGLFLCQSIVRSLGGTVGFSSEPGGGSTFWVELPASSHQSVPRPRVS